MQLATLADLLPAFDQPLVQRIVLVGVLRDVIWRAIASSSHIHWNTAVSNTEVGVSALYSSSFAGPCPL